METVSPKVLGLKIVLMSEREEEGGRFRIPAMDMGIFHLIFSQSSKLFLMLYPNLVSKKFNSVGKIAIVIPFYR